jgi:hypothetical protein
MVKDNSHAVAETLHEVIQMLTKLQENDRVRVLNSVSIFFSHDSSPTVSDATASSAATSQVYARPAFSDDRAPSPKEFLFQKQPKTDVERIACLAFYLTHFRDMTHFKTIDLGKLNTEAAQIKFSNTAYAADNATKAGYLAPAARAQKQITAWGEQFVAALPDREAAMKIVAQARNRKNKRRQR